MAGDLPEEEAAPARHAVAAFPAFVAAGAIPLVPCVIPRTGSEMLLLGAIVAASAYGAGVLVATVVGAR